MTYHIRNSEVLHNASLEHIDLKPSKTLHIATTSYDILLVAKGSCRIDGVCCVGQQGNPYTHTLSRGNHTVESIVGGDALCEIVIIHVDRQQLFGDVMPTSREQQRFESAVMRGISSNASVDELAAICCLSVSTYKRRFQDYYGIPPHRWFLWRRLEIALLMLRHTTLPTFAIAHLCGFINVSHFIATFKRRYDITPSRLLRSNANPAMAVSPLRGSQTW